MVPSGLEKRRENRPCSWTPASEPESGRSGKAGRQARQGAELQQCFLSAFMLPLPRLNFIPVPDSFKHIALSAQALKVRSVEEVLAYRPGYYMIRHFCRPDYTLALAFLAKGVLNLPSLSKLCPAPAVVRRVRSRPGIAFRVSVLRIPGQALRPQPLAFPSFLHFHLTALFLCSYFL